MIARIRFPSGLERESAAIRCRWWAGLYRKLCPDNLRMIALLEEVAIELDLGERTHLTYRGNPEPGDRPPA